jgi:hypothetical protein
MERVKSSDVLDPTHEVTKAFTAITVGSFRRVGPNSWDDYEFVRKAGRTISASEATDCVEVLPTVLVQYESRGACVRIRAEGKVLRVEFQPTAVEIATLSKQLGTPYEPLQHVRQLRQYFEGTYLRQLGQGDSLGAAAVIVGKLSDK